MLLKRCSKGEALGRCLIPWNLVHRMIPSNASMAKASTPGDPSTLTATDAALSSGRSRNGENESKDNFSGTVKPPSTAETV